MARDASRGSPRIEGRVFFETVPDPSSARRRAGIERMTMATYRIKKGKRVFKAAKLATLTELAGRGLLAPDDRISVDGGPFGRVGDMEELRGALAEATAVQLEQDEPTTDETAGDGILEAFLSEVQDAEVGATTGKVPVQPPAPVGLGKRRPRPAPVVGRIERESPPAIPELVTSSVETLPGSPPTPRSTPPAAVSPSSPSPVSPPSDESVLQSEKFRAAQARLNAMAAGAGAPSVPISFADWVAKRDEDGETKTVLENFGMDDTLVALQQAPQIHATFSVFRLLIVVTVGAILVGGYWLFVKTGANQQFPVESQLGLVGGEPPRARGQDDPRPSVEAATPAVVGAAAERARDAGLRKRVGSDVLDFGNLDEFEAAIFIELQNLGCRPLSLQVDVLASRGTRPLEVDLTIRQSPVPEGTKKLDEIQDRLGTTWMLVGKYGELGKVRARTVVVELDGQLTTKRSGTRLIQLFKGATTSKSIFLEE